MTRQQADRLFLSSLLALLVGVFVGCGFWFAPGWAKGWPGLTQRVVWPAGVTALVFVIGIWLVVGSGAAACSRLGSGRDQVAPGALAVWLVCGEALVAVVCWWVYRDLDSAVRQLWP